jgi:hypothetical protein
LGFTLFNPTSAWVSLGYAVANPTYAKIEVSRVLSVNQGTGLSAFSQQVKDAVEVNFLKSSPVWKNLTNHQCGSALLNPGMELGAE